MSASVGSQTWKVAAIIAIVGALLSGAINGAVVGAIAAWYSVEQSRKEAVHALSTFVYERRARAELLASSLRRRADLEELRERKRQYDEVYVNWNKNLQANLFRIRDVLQSHEYSFFEQQTEFRLTAIFRDIDRCLTEAYDARIAASDPIATLDRCDMKRQLQKSIDCGYAIGDELYRIARVPFLSWLSVGSRSFQQAREEIVSKCGSV